MNNQVQNLPSVTLIACDGDTPNRTVRVLNHCARPLEEMGMRYATVAQAGSYSWEHYVEDAESGPAVSFGFHGWVAGKTPDQFEKLMSNDQAHP